LGGGGHHPRRRLAQLEDADQHLSRQSWLQGRERAARPRIPAAGDALWAEASDDHRAHDQYRTPDPDQAQPSALAEPGAGDRLCRHGRGQCRARLCAADVRRQWLAGDRRHPPLDRGNGIGHRQALRRAERGGGGIMRLLLASQSQTRQQMLAAAGVAFETVAALLDEEAAKAGLAAAGFEPRDTAEMLAELKAKSVAAGPDALVIGADQVLELDDGTILSKPGSREEALAQLRLLSGGTHYLHSAAVVAERGERVWGETETVAMDVRQLSDDFLQ